ncbi:PREDICTED: angiotensin-converting enzyme-like isoform X2 [Trachymyrmex cornetzi]|uniref:angiotensin-converting enzyme-like isoform X2 n=1 Tax=Trachymyrmex cornetzi TaxID=471704 RepID=UPI00084F3E00|nr:PREDICTED: angiotensin-converting enzyme-like isoform X2 [Trachymyrmex cornetzi]
MLHLILVAAVVTLVAAKPTIEDTVDISKNHETTDDLLKSAHELLKRTDAEYAKWDNKQSITAWNYASNLINENLTVTVEGANVTKHIIERVKTVPWRDFDDESMKRQFYKLGILGGAALSEESSNEFEMTESKMENIYSTV